MTNTTSVKIVLSQLNTFKVAPFVTSQNSSLPTLFPACLITVDSQKPGSPPSGGLGCSSAGLPLTSSGPGSVGGHPGSSAHTTEL